MYKLLDYDITEYKQLENTLNELSKQGYNPTSLGKISRFEKNEKHYYFHVDLLIKKPATPKRKALHDFINEYEKQMFDYYGKIGKFIIFTTDNKRALPKERQKAIDEYLSTRKISATTYFVDFLFFFCRTACFTKKSDSRISYKWKYFNLLLTSSSICDNSYSLPL